MVNDREALDAMSGIVQKNNLWGCPLWANITCDGWRVGGVYRSPEEAEEAAKKSTLRLQTIRIQ